MSEAAPPSHASIVIVGGGVMGCSVLYHLAKAGVSDAILVERNRLTSGTTWHSAAQVRALRSSRSMTEMIRYSISLYSDLERETGQATGWINKGSLSLATTSDRMIHIRRQAGLARLYGIRAEIVSPDEAAALWPHMNAADVIGAVWSPEDGRVSPSDLCAALVKGARSRGAKIYEATTVEAILTRDGQVRGLETSAGRITCDALVICAGLWSREVGALAGTDVPLWPCEHYYLLTRPVPGIEGNLPTLSDHDAHLYIRDDSGGLLVGCFEPHARPVDPGRLGPNFAFQLLPEDWDHFEPMMAGILRRLPLLANVEIKGLLNGPESFTPDGSFLLGETPETRGLYLGCGMNSVGVATAGGAGRALAETILGGRSSHDLSEVHPARLPAGLWTAKALAARAPEVLGRHYEIAHPGRSWRTARDLRTHPLGSRFSDCGAHFGQFYGWERPLFYGAAATEPLTFGRPRWFERVAREVDQAHRHAAVFDLTSLGLIDVVGPDAARFLDRLCANRMDRAVGRAAYTQMLNPSGGIESDLTAVRLSETSYRLTTGTGAIRRDLAWLRRHVERERVTLHDRTDDFGTLGLMGPSSGAVMRALGAKPVAELGYFQSAEIALGGIDVRAVRLSYVGEAGWELSCRIAHLPVLWDMLIGGGAVPAGLYAQTSMRIEKRFLSLGQDIDARTTPLEAGLDFAVDWTTDFIGREALLRSRETRPRNKLATVVLSDPVATPIGDEPVLLNGAIVGNTTSAAFGHRVNLPVAIARFEDGMPEAANAQVEVEIAGERVPARFCPEAAFDPAHTRLRAPCGSDGKKPSLR